MPELLIFVGYTIILIIDKVLFDTHALFADNEHARSGSNPDPANAQFEESVRNSMSKARSAEMSNDPAELKKSLIEEREEVEDAVKSYLNPHDRFATRMRASMNKGSKAENGEAVQQNNLFVDQSNVNLSNDKSKLKRIKMFVLI